MCSPSNRPQLRPRDAKVGFHCHSLVCTAVAWPPVLTCCTGILPLPQDSLECMWRRTKLLVICSSRGVRGVSSDLDKIPSTLVGDKPSAHWLCE